MVPCKGNKNDGTKGLGMCKFPHEEDYICDRVDGLFSPENFP